VATETLAAPEVQPPRPMTADEIERHWFEHVYAGDRMPQLTLRAVLMGMVLGMIMACSNVYVGLKAGWSLGVAITCSILAYSFFSAFTPLQRAFARTPLGRGLGVTGADFSILENNAMQSCASAAGSMTTGGLVNAIPALMMLNPAAIPTDNAHRYLWLIPWLCVISWLGVFLAVPAKRQMINVEQLPFPSGIAAATTLRTLHTRSGEAARQAWALGIAGLFGVVITWMRDATAGWLKEIPIPGAFKSSPIQGWVAPTWAPWLRYPRIQSTWGTHWVTVGMLNGKTLRLDQLTLSFEGSLLFVAAGAIISFRQAWSMMLGAIVNFGILAPAMLQRGDIEAASFSRISRWSVWTGVPMLVTSGLLMFFMNWRSVVRAFGTVTAFLSRRSAADDPMNRIEVPGTWFVVGYAALGIAAIVMGHAMFHIQYWMGVVALLATFFLVVVAARATGETDITPVGPLSKITQLTFGALAPGNISTNLMTANISAGATGHAGDLLTDLKSGYLLGANPRQQFLAQFFGVLAGGIIVVPVYFFLIPNVSMLGTEKWPAPAALVWRAVAELLAKGVSSLPTSARIGLVVGSSVGILLPLLEKWLPKYKRFIPSATGLGLAFTINGFNTVSFFIGSLIALGLAKWRPKTHEKYTVPVASGIIAGESLMGVAIALLTAAQVLQ
jgi:uncharacterized oligopeptide transporter (OPT) family protein